MQAPFFKAKRFSHTLGQASGLVSFTIWFIPEVSFKSWLIKWIKTPRSWAEKYRDDLIVVPLGMITNCTKLEQDGREQYTAMQHRGKWVIDKQTNRCDIIKYPPGNEQQLDHCCGCALHVILWHHTERKCFRCLVTWPQVTVINRNKGFGGQAPCVVYEANYPNHDSGCYQ